jgi:micrococcal nuclease
MLFLVVLAAFAASAGGKPQDGGARVSARVTEVVDGDTIKVRSQGGRDYTVNLIGIDAPEMKRPDRLECGGRQAIHNLLQLTFTNRLDSDGDHFFDGPMGMGRRVTLTTDPRQGRFDRRGHLLAYVSTVAGTQLQLDQLIRGWARVNVSAGRFRRYTQFRRAQADAERVSHGVWSKCGGDFHRPA